MQNIHFLLKDWFFIPMGIDFFFNILSHNTSLLFHAAEFYSQQKKISIPSTIAEEYVLTSKERFVLKGTKVFLGHLFVKLHTYIPRLDCSDCTVQYIQTPSQSFGSNDSSLFILTISVTPSLILSGPSIDRFLNLNRPNLNNLNLNLSVPSMGLQRILSQTYIVKLYLMSISTLAQGYDSCFQSRLSPSIFYHFLFQCLSFCCKK